MLVKSFLDDIRGEKNGFKFGRPWHYHKNSLAAILPIIRKSEEQRSYITLVEAANKVIIEDSGSISEAIVTNKGDKPVFIRAGEILKGSTQTRAVVISRIVMPKQTARVKIVCVYASKGISRGATFAHAGYAPSSVENIIINEAYRGRGVNVNQSQVWQGVTSYSANIANYSDPSIRRSSSQDIKRGIMDTLSGIGGAAGGAGGFIGYTAADTSDDLEGTMKKFSMTMQDIFKSLPKVDWQTGAVLLGVDGVIGLEVFDLPDSWTAMKKELAEKEAEHLVKENQENAFEFKEEKAKGMATKILEKKFSEKDLYKDEKTKTIGIELATYLGQVTFLGDHIIHLNITSKM